MDELLAKLAGLLKSQQGQDAGISDVSIDPDTDSVGFEHDGDSFLITLDTA